MGNIPLGRKVADGCLYRYHLHEKSASPVFRQLVRFPSTWPFGILFAVLQMRKVQISQFTPPESAAKLDSKNEAVTFPFEESGAGDCQNLRVSSAVSRFSSLEPSFLAPFARRLPEASSGLCRPARPLCYLPVWYPRSENQILESPLANMVEIAA